MDKTFLGQPKGLVPKIVLALGFLAVLGTSACANLGLVDPTSAAAVATDTAAIAADATAVLTGIQVTCKDIASGETVVALIDPAAITANSTALSREQAACALINAVPATAQ